MAISFRITARRTSITDTERNDLGLWADPPTNTVPTPDHTIVDVEVLERDASGNVAIVATFQHAYVRGSTSKLQLADQVRNKASNRYDQHLFGSGGEAGMVGIEFPV